MKARSKFLLGALAVAGSAGYLMASSIRETGVYYVLPDELTARVAADSTFYGTGVKMSGHVVAGSIVREPGTRTIRFVVRDTADRVRVPIVYRGIAPDTFTENVDVVVEGRLGRDGVFHATTLLAKCASRYESAPQPGQATGDNAAAYARP